LKTDHLFYQIFLSYPQLFFELIGRADTNVSRYEFQSVELKETASRIDGIFVPNTTKEPIFFVEVQFQREPEIYARLFKEIFIYFHQFQLRQDWRAVVIFPQSSLEPDPDFRFPYRALLHSEQLQRIYLEDLRERDDLTLGLEMLRLIVEPETQAQTLATNLIARAKVELEEETYQNTILELLETIIVSKYPQISSEEVAAMFGLEDLKKTRVYQEAKQEGKQEGELEAAAKLIARGFTVEEVAEMLGLESQKINDYMQE